MLNLEQSKFNIKLSYTMHYLTMTIAFVAHWFLWAFLNNFKPTLFAFSNEVAS